jgi:hypothetical protein
MFSQSKNISTSNEIRRPIIVPDIMNMTHDQVMTSVGRVYIKQHLLSQKKILSKIDPSR